MAGPSQQRTARAGHEAPNQRALDKHGPWYSPFNGRRDDDQNNKTEKKMKTEKKQQLFVRTRVGMILRICTDGDDDRTHCLTRKPSVRVLLKTRCGRSSMTLSTNSAKKLLAHANLGRFEN